MNAIELIRRLHEHRAHVNGLLLDAAEQLDHEQLQRSLPIGQGSVWRSLLHMYAAEYVWLGALQGDPEATLPGDLPGGLPGNQAAGGSIATLPRLQEKWSVLQKRWEKYLAALAEVNLDESVYKVSTSSGGGRKLATRRGDVLLHLALHAQYTTAQVVNMLRQLGVKHLPDVMLITLARRQHPENERS